MPEGGWSDAGGVSWRIKLIESARGVVAQIEFESGCELPDWTGWFFIRRFSQIYTDFFRIVGKGVKRRLTRLGGEEAGEADGGLEPPWAAEVLGEIDMGVARAKSAFSMVSIWAQKRGSVTMTTSSKFRWNER